MISRVFQWFGASAKSDTVYGLELPDLVWALGSVSSVNQKPFDADLLVRELPSPPLTTDSLISASKLMGFRSKRLELKELNQKSVAYPCVALLDQARSVKGGAEDAPPNPVPKAPALVVQVNDNNVLLFRSRTNQAQTVSKEQFLSEFTGTVFQFAPIADEVKDPDDTRAREQAFGFGWFIPELLKYKRVWRDVLIASLLIQFLALGMPLFTQVVIDKVVVHRTQSTLAVIAIGMAIFSIFSALLTWMRQYLVLHTGNRVDAVLGSAVFNHLIRLPPRYFETRPTGVITARLRGVENIREFIASAAVTLVLDIPFLLIFVAIMVSYSMSLTFITLGILSLVVVLSFFVAPIFRARLNDQFLFGARNQAFTTEYVAGLETVKSLQMEAQLKTRYDAYLADYLRSGFAVRQVANTYNVVANSLEQAMNLLILVVGALYVMDGTAFTIGMLVAFQMFAGRVSQPMLRIVGIWQQFQQASLSVARLGDIMNAPSEPYSVVPSRAKTGAGAIKLVDLGFRYAPNLPFLFRGLNFSIDPGRVIAVMGPSGCGKSTLSKLLQGFYLPSEGRITIDDVDSSQLSANELRNTFGVVPQETILFSGTVLENLTAANPHTEFSEVVKACQIAEIHDAIQKLPAGYGTPIGERGVGLSGGQKQRLAIARALLKRPRVLLFDEATSSLDAKTAEQFCATINQMKGSVSMLFITHALPKALAVDAIMQFNAEQPPIMSNLVRGLEQ